MFFISSIDRTGIHLFNCYNYLNTFNTLPILMVYWNEKFPKILVLSLIFPILRAPVPVPKYREKNTDYHNTWKYQFWNVPLPFNRTKYLTLLWVLKKCRISIFLMNLLEGNPLSLQITNIVVNVYTWTW